MPSPKRALPLVLTLLALGPAASAADFSPLRTSEVKISILADSGGMTVYTFDPDTAGHSNCTGPCAAAWPPVKAPASALQAPLSAIDRPDGTRQIAYMGRPLYTFSNDSRPGDILGDGLHGRWHIVKP